MEEIIVTVQFHFTNIPVFLQEIVKNNFMKHRSEAVEIFNSLIERINKEWDRTGKSALINDNIDSMNPEYAKFVKDRIQPSLDELNKKLVICRYLVDEENYCDLVGYVPGIKNSKIYITIKEVEP